MNYSIDCERIFFDRYILSENEKKRECSDILKQAFDNMEKVTIDGFSMTRDVMGIEEEKKFEEIVQILKKEFFILIKHEVMKNEIKCDIEALVEEYINENYLYEAFSVEDVALKAGITRKNLDNMFIKRHGKTVSEYIRFLRCEKAKELLINGEKTQTAAELCGFGSVKTMQRAFKHILGKTPGAFK